MAVARLDLGVLECAGPDEEGGEKGRVVHVGDDGLAAVVPVSGREGWLNVVIRPALCLLTVRVTGKGKEQRLAGRQCSEAFPLK